MIAIGDKQVAEKLQTALQQPLLSEQFHLPVISEHKIRFADVPSFAEVSVSISGTVDKSADVLIGIVTIDKADHAFVKAKRVFSAKEISFEGDRDACDAAMAAIRAIGQQFVLRIDLSVLDQGFATKGVAGGFSPRQLLYFATRLAHLKNYEKTEIIGVTLDTVEIAAKLARELC